MALLTRNYLLLAKTEVAYGTDPVPDGNNAVLVTNLQITTPNDLVSRDDMATGTISPSPPIFARNYYQMTFDAEFKGSGSPGSPAGWSEILNACGFNMDVVISTSLTYTPLSADFESCTIYAYRDGLLYKMTGARGSVKINWTVGQRPMLSFTMMGIYNSPIDAPIISPNFDTTLPPLVKSASFSLGGYASVISSLEWDMGNTVTISDDMNATTGYGEVLITARTCQGTIDPEATLIATHDYWDALESGTQQALTITLGSALGSTIEFTAPKCVFRDITENDRNGIYAYNIPFTTAQNAGDDEVQILVD